MTTKLKDKNGTEIFLSNKVQWVAEASGKQKAREGLVVELLPAGAEPKTKTRLNGGIRRNDRSHRVVVAVERKHAKGSTTDYFCPPVSRVCVVGEKGAPFDEQLPAPGTNAA